MGYGCNAHKKALQDCQTEQKACKKFSKKYFAYDNCIQGPDGGAACNCVHFVGKWKPKKLKGG